MIVRIILFIILLVPSLALIEKHTSVFNQYWLSIGNNNAYFYDPLTFGMDLYQDPCTIIDNRQFRNNVNNMMLCVGQWCRNEKFSCLPGYDAECYQIEHIIDENQGGYLPELTNIAANRVMAWSKWNTQLGFTLSYDDSKREKEDVYGLDRVLMAETWIKQCAYGNDSGIPIVSIAILVLFVVAVLILILIRRKIRNQGFYTAIAI